MASLALRYVRMVYYRPLAWYLHLKARHLSLKAMHFLAQRPIDTVAPQEMQDYMRAFNRLQCGSMNCMHQARKAYRGEYPFLKQPKQAKTSSFKVLP